MSGPSPITLHSWPQAILHLDGDAFFASCEQAIHPELKGRPVITGAERNIVASMSYEAKARGVKRAVPLWQARRRVPDAVILPSDYETYSLISKRMFGILLRFTPAVEESSIDEGWADLTGLRRLYRTRYEEIARRMRAAVEKELDIPVSCGLSLTKTLAKLASRYRKPRGFTAVPGYKLHLFLARIPASEVSGIGPNTTALLAKKGVHTALDYVCRPEPWIHALLGKTGAELWRELRGEMVYPVQPGEKTSYASVSKTKTFAPPSSEHGYVKAQLFRNAESALIKIRRYHLQTRRLTAFLTHQDFKTDGLEASLTRPAGCPLELFPLLREIFRSLFRSGTLYRQTGVVLTHLVPDSNVQYEFFEDPVKIQKMQRLSRALDEINRFYGKHSVFSGQGLFLGDSSQRGKRAPLPERKRLLLPGETARQKLGIPWVRVKV